MAEQLLHDKKSTFETTEIEKQILNQVEAIEDDIIRAIVDVVRIDSVQGEAQENAPYGIGVKAALDHTLKLAASMGFQTKNIDNHIGYAYYGESEDYVCAIGHLDVVPVETGWKYPPFSGQIEGGRIFGRGVLDNKGPLYSCLFALAVLKGMGVVPKRQVRVIFGCNEESGFQDLKYYLEREKAPLAGFTPDCKYPVVYAERGRAVIQVTSEKTDTLLAYVNELVLNQGNDGKRMGIAFENREFGKLETRNHRFVDAQHFQFAVSYPAGIIIDSILEKLRKTEFDVAIAVENNYDPVFFNKDCPMVRVMQESYEKVTGLDGRPVTTTGGTYAKLMPNIVPFGPSFPGQKGISHQPNEWMNISDIMANAKIYALTLYRLACEGKL